MGGPGMMPSGPAEKPDNFGATMKTLARYIRPFWLQLLIVVVFAIVSTVFAVAGPRLLGDMTNLVVDGFVAEQAYTEVTDQLPPGQSIPAGTTGAEILEQLPDSVVNAIPESAISTISDLDFSQPPSMDFEAIGRLALILVGLYLVSALFGYLQGFIMARVAQMVSYRLRTEIVEKIDRLPLSYFDGTTQGEVLSRVTNDVETVSQTLNQSLSQIIISTVTIIGIVAMMLSISWQMTLVAFVMLPVSFALVRLIVGQSQQYFQQQQESLGQLNGHVEEMFSGHMVMRVFGGETASVEKFQTINVKLHESAWKSQFYSGLMMPVMSFVGNIAYVAVSILGGWLAAQGTIRVGDIQAFIQYLNQFTQPITQAASVVNVLQSTAAAAERVFNFLDATEELNEDELTKKLDDVQGKVEFKNVRFGYDPDNPVIRDMNLDIEPGQRIAIVGQTGAGKTTLVNLLMRFYDADSGQILIDGVDIREMKREDVRALFAMVLQDSWLFNGSIEDNIGYSRDGATHDEIVKAAAAAHADHFIRSLPGGYDMEINESIDNISQGEKQLLTIARAMLAESPMLILDEATSSVDTRTEVLIQKAMDKLMEGKTSFVIAHRLSTIRNADKILVMDDGDIVEQGTHDELLAQNGVYADLYASQFEEAA